MQEMDNRNNTPILPPGAYGAPQQPQSQPPEQPGDSRFDWRLIPLNLLPGCLILLSFVVDRYSSLPDVFNLFEMLVLFAAPIAVGCVNVVKCSKAARFNMLQLVLFVATVGANELHTRLWLDHISSDPGSSMVGFLGSLVLGVAIVVTTIIGNVMLAPRGRGK